MGKCAHARRRAHARARTHAHTQPFSHTRMHAHKHARSHAATQPHSHARTSPCNHAPVYQCTNAHTGAHPHAHAPPMCLRTRALMQCNHSHMQTCLPHVRRPFEIDYCLALTENLFRARACVRACVRASCIHHACVMHVCMHAHGRACEGAGRRACVALGCVRACVHTGFHHLHKVVDLLIVRDRRHPTCTCVSAYERASTRARFACALTCMLDLPLPLCYHPATHRNACPPTCLHTCLCMNSWA